MVVEADDTSDLPYSIFVLPEVNELRLADRLGVFTTIDRLARQTTGARGRSTER